MTKRKSKRKGRFSARKKVEAVRRLVAGEDLDVLARQLGITAATLATWRDKFLQVGQASGVAKRIQPHRGARAHDGPQPLAALWALHRV